MKQVASWWISLSVPLLLLATSVRLAMTSAWLTFEYTRPGFSVDAYGFSVEDRLRYGPKGVDYLLSADGIEVLAALVLPGALCYPPSTTSCPMFNALELRHMEDVKQVVQSFFGAAWVAAVGSLLSAVWLRSHSTKFLWRALWRGGLWAVGGMIAIALSAVAAWDTFFNVFHSLFFEDDTWQFYYSDSLIRLYPEQFWFDSALVVSALTALGAVLCVALGWRQLTLEDERISRETWV
ncbi:MAG: TIGR01906 family membrane protein [Anaerolineae bacterium]|nr:TIGR01906 family membrane protein [Anaerolineae bacterium]